MDNQLKEESKQRLLQQKQRLEEELSSFASKDPNSQNNWNATYPHFGEGSADKFNQEQAEDEIEEYANRVPQEESLEKQLQQVNEALARIEQGTYGTCAQCGKDIAPERLKAAPESALCSECSNNNSAS